MSSIEDAIDQLETSASKLKQLSVEESRAIRDAVKEATREATSRVKAEFKEKKSLARKEASEAEKAIKDLQQAAIRNENMFEVLMEATKYCSLGQLTEAMFEVGGQYRRNM